MSKNRIKDSYPHIRDLFSFSKEEVLRLKKYSSQIYPQDELRLPFGRVDIDHLEVLDLSLRSLLEIDTFQKKKKDFRRRLLSDEFEETLTEIVIGGLLTQSNIPIRSFEYEYRYDNNLKDTKDLDICALIGDHEVFFEIATRRKYNHKRIVGIQGIDGMHFRNIRRKYEDKKIEQAHRSRLLPAQPLIFVINSFRSLQHVFLNNAEPFLGKCELLHSLIMFSGYRIVNDGVKLSQANIYCNPWCTDSIKYMVDNKILTELIKNWSVDIRYDLEVQQKTLNGRSVR